MILFSFQFIINILNLSYFGFFQIDLGVLRSKMTELNGEIGRLTTAIDKNSKEQQSMASLENKVKEMALEILELQGQAADLNLLQEKIATSSDPSQMEAELKSLTNENERESHQVERIFEDVKSVKEKVATLEKAIQIVSSFLFS